MSELERAIFAAAYVDALRNIACHKPVGERVRDSERKAEYVVESFRRYRTGKAL